MIKTKFESQEVEIDLTKENPTLTLQDLWNCKNDVQNIQVTIIRNNERVRVLLKDKWLVFYNSDNGN